MSIIIRAEKVEYRHLRPGELFSESGPEYWSKQASGENEYEELMLKMVKEADAYPADVTLFRITIVDSDMVLVKKEALPTTYRQFDPNVPPGYKK